MDPIQDRVNREAEALAEQEEIRARLRETWQTTATQKAALEREAIEERNRLIGQFMPWAQRHNIEPDRCFSYLLIPRSCWTIGYKDYRSGQNESTGEWTHIYTPIFMTSSGKFFMGFEGRKPHPTSRETISPGTVERAIAYHCRRIQGLAWDM